LVLWMEQQSDYLQVLEEPIVDTQHMVMLLESKDVLPALGAVLVAGNQIIFLIIGMGLELYHKERG
jgi:hypothetical protein